MQKNYQKCNLRNVPQQKFCKIHLPKIPQSTPSPQPTDTSCMAVK